MWRLVFGVGVLSLVTGCSFNRDWKRATAYPRGTNDITGQWTGEWRSETNSHHGTLRCIITPNAPNAYMGRFRARFWKIFAAGYTVPLNVTNIDGKFTLSGSADLGFLGGGVYTYKGSADHTNFQCAYESKRDHGQFIMRRPEAKERVR
jgi:hypothetical protein